MRNRKKKSDLDRERRLSSFQDHWRGKYGVHEYSEKIVKPYKSLGYLFAMKRKRLVLIGGLLLALAAAGLYLWNWFVVTTFREAAEAGDRGAQWTLGYIYARGLIIVPDPLGVWRDYEEAVRLYRQAAEQGHSLAQTELGHMYSSGEGVLQDYAEALKWHRLAAEQGDGGAQLIVADIYYRTKEGFPQDYAEAAKWYRRAASQGIVRATLILGEMHEYGRGVQHDLVQAYVWYQLAAKWRSPHQLSSIPERHRKRAAVDRDRVAEQLSPEQLALAQELARDWIGKFSK